MSDTPPTDTFPRQYARTRRFTLGEPRSFQISPDGTRIAFLRSAGGSDPVHALWCADVGADDLISERLVADPASLIAGKDSVDLPAAERARRERLREQAEGITSFATDDAVMLAAYTLGGGLFITDLISGVSRKLRAQDSAFDPRPAPNGALVAYVSHRCLRVIPSADAHASADAGRGSDGTESGHDRLLAGDHDVNVSWGGADFIAAEELNRNRGFWWSPDSTQIVAARVDETAVTPWHIADPANPQREPRVHRYPAAGTNNADVSLAVIDVTTAAMTPVVWDRDAFPYLVEVSWSQVGLHVVVMNRPQTVQLSLAVDPATGAATVAHEVVDEVWVELTPGTPKWLSDGRLVSTVDVDHDVFGPAGLFGSRTLVIGGQAVTPPGMQVRRVVDVDDDRVVFTASVDVGTTIAAYVADVRAPERSYRAFSATDGMIDVTAAGALAVLRVAGLDLARPRFDVARLPVMTQQMATTIGSLSTHAETALVTPVVRMHALVERGINIAVVLPSGDTGSTRWPVLLDPYGGPHAQRVVSARGAYLSSQWFADQGFAVVVIDGRGTPGWGPRHEKAVHLDLATPALDDQIMGLQTAAQIYPQLDLSRVAIRGWSFGGYLAALAVLRRPDVFHAAVAGAPVTEWRLYDTGYTERYLGHPDADPGPYDRCSLLLEAHALSRPLMLIHGLADDNVVAAHTLRLSSALLAAGRPHEVLPLSGVTHMTPQDVVAENLLLLQVAFLKRALSIR